MTRSIPADVESDDDFVVVKPRLFVTGGRARSRHGDEVEQSKPCEGLKRVRIETELKVGYLVASI